ncbi:glycosyltransferase, partial [bacterium]|nr:glycosyltransferase [bacterium]
TLFTSYVNPQATWIKKCSEIRTSFLQSWPSFILKHKAFLSIFLPFAFESFDFNGYDLIISVTSFAAKGILPKPTQKHICYLLTPTRFLYSHTEDYLSKFFLISQPFYRYLRRFDQVAATRPDKIYAISQLVAKRCQKYYHRNVDGVIYPTIFNTREAKEEKKTGLPDKFFLCVGRLTSYKKIKLVIQTCGQLGFPLVVIGTGPEYKSLRKLVNHHHWSQIQLLGNQSEKTLKMYYNKALALVAPGLEDFGINLLEANSQGTLVITHPESGARELLSNDQALDLDPQDLAGSLQKVLQRVYRQSKNRVTAQKADTASFKKNWQKKVTYEHKQ